MAIMAKRRFDLARMFHPSAVSLSGAQTPLGRILLANLQAGGFSGALDTGDGAMENADLALVADAPEDVPVALATHAARGARGAVVFSQAPGLDEMARAAGIRVLGPHSFGMVLPGLGLNASCFSLAPARGRVALVGQSSAIAHTVIDWAVPNGVGFSHIIGIGGNADIGFGLVLDHLSRDADTRAIMLEIDRLRNPRAFLSAARAAARLRPVVAIAPGLRLRDALGGPLALEAALARAGVLLTSSISEFLAAAETLTRVKPARGERLAIVTNSVSIGRLAADEALRSGLALAELSPETAQVLALALGEMPPPGPIFARKDKPTQLADIAAMLSSAPEIGGILVVHAPTGAENDATAIEALLACAQTVKVPLLIAAMGEAQGLAHRHRLSQARLACFDTPEAAVAGFRHLLRNRRNRAAARELPASEVLSISPDTARVASEIATARARGAQTLVQDEALAIAAAYHIPIIRGLHATTPDEAAQAAAKLGFPAVVKLLLPGQPTIRRTGSVALDLPDAAAVRSAAADMAMPGADFIVQTQAPRGTALRIRVSDHPIMGPIIGFGAGGGERADLSGLAAELPPLNLALAHALIHRAPVAPQLAAHRGQPAADLDAIAKTLVRVSQLIIDTPDIALLDLDPVFANEDGVVAASARIRLRAAGEKRPALVFAPYPRELTQTYEAKGQRFTLRPIRPEDADAHAAMLARFSPEDMRYRFFAPLQRLPVAQITRLTDVDYTREMAIIAVRAGSGETVGVARLVRDDTDGLTGEFAVAVEPAAKGLGLGTVLMNAIIAWGQAQGVQEINGPILADNAPMRAFIQNLGFSLSRDPDDPDIVEATLLLPPRG